MTKYSDQLEARIRHLDGLNMALATDLVSAAKAIDECAMDLEEAGCDETRIMLLRRTANDYWNRAVALRPVAQPKPARLSEAET